MTTISTDDALWKLRNTTDPTTYLTYIEENITKEKLHVLEEVLQQDEELTETIGWDLVATLIPLLPESTDCLITVARLGNAKECCLKVAEALRHLRFDDTEDEDEDVGTEAESADTTNVQLNGANLQELPLVVLQFEVLLRMLGLLHPRIKAKMPSRFLSTSLQAILAAYATASNHHDILTIELVKFIKAVSLTGTKRPQLPPRRSSSNLLLATLSSKPPAFGPLTPPSEQESEEDRIHKKLLQSFLTHTLDDYMQSLQPYDDISGLAWCTRYWEQIEHPYIIPSQVKVTDRFSNSAELEIRLTTVGQLVAVAQDLEIHSDDLLATILDPTPEEEGDRTQEQDSPSSASSIPLSKDGALYLYTARKAMEILYGGPTITDDMPIFPGHAMMVRVFIEGIDEDGIRTIPEPLLDALLFHGLIALHKNNIATPKSDEQFADYLQAVSLVSAAVRSPTIRFQAHYLTTSTLHAHPKDVVRFAYIRDTLEHCPFENLKATAVSWIKDETVLAIKSPFLKPDPDQPSTNPDTSIDESTSLFATSIPLSTLASDLWPDVSAQYNFSSASPPPPSPSHVPASPQITAIHDPQQSYHLLLANYGFYSATLNFLLLLLRSQHLHIPLNLKDLLDDNETIKNFVYPLRDAAAQFETLGKLEGRDEAVGGQTGSTELGILEMLSGDVDKSIRELGWFVEEVSL